jgi:hypothetical protein
MTNKEAVIATIQITGFPDAGVNKALLDAGIDETVNYSVGNKKIIDLAAIEVLQGMLAVASVSEGSYSISYSIAGVQARISYLSGLHGISTQPKVRAVKLW